MIRAPGSCFALAHTLKAQRSLTADTYTLRFYLYNTLHMACKTTEYEMYVMHANCYVLPGIFNSAWYLCAGISAQLYFSSCIWTVIHTSGFKYICIILTAVLFYYYCQPFKSIALRQQGLFFISVWWSCCNTLAILNILIFFCFSNMIIMRISLYAHLHIFMASSFTANVDWRVFCFSYNIVKML